MAGFFILSAFVSFPTQIFLFYSKSNKETILLKESFDGTNILSTVCIIIQGIELFLVTFQIFIAFFVIRHLSEIRSNEFHLNILIKNNTSAINRQQ